MIFGRRMDGYWAGCAVTNIFWGFKHPDDGYWIGGLIVCAIHVIVRVVTTTAWRDA